MTRAVVCFLISASLAGSCRFSSRDLPGKGAEDLWGDKVHLNREIRSDDPVVMVPFSTSNCGYCLIDGYFTEYNYIRNNLDEGGTAYHMCLFNPQLDIYGFQKHFGWREAVLTFPPGLHAYHENGFPTLLAFRDGKQLVREFHNYAHFDSLNQLLWEGKGAMRPAGNLHMATRLIYENESFQAVCVVSDTAEISAEERAYGSKWKAYTFSTFQTISDGERQKHLFIQSGPDLTALSEFFRGEDVPVSFEGKEFRVGEYRFNPDTVAFYGCFPNPFNRQRYTVLTIYNDHAKLFDPVNYLDYVLFSGSQPDAGKKLLYGHFAKDEHNRWRFSAQTAFSEVQLEPFCIGKCPAPGWKYPGENRSRSTAGAPPTAAKTAPPVDAASAVSVTADGSLFTLGASACRFPDICAAPDSSCWVTWEEEGDIWLAHIDPDGRIGSWPVEHSPGDSYNPRVVAVDDEIWVFYLHNRDGYYRLYAKAFKGGRFSGEVAISPMEPVDVLTPEAIPGQSGTIVVAWCEWRANQRFLRYRELAKGIPSAIREIKSADPVYIKGYTNAWWPSLVLRGHEIWGAWNQHYPATCGVYGGRLSDTAGTVTQPSEAMEDREQGGYPDIFTDGKDVFVVWEGNGWNVYYDRAVQEIRIAVHDSGTGRFSPGRVLTVEGLTTLNQTPAGACDSKGNKFIVWSGRDHRKGQPWGVYMVTETGGKWSDPVLVSDPGEAARHPRIVAGPDDRVWISWHNGSGKNMRVKVLTQ